MKPPLNQIAYLVTYTRNAYGDFVTSTTTAIKCRIREINRIQIGVNEEINSDAMGWFEPDSGIERNSIVLFDGVYYQVERVVKARTFSTPVQFIKTEMKKYGQIS